MTEKLYDIDSYIKEFDANVISCCEDGGKFKVVLDKTAFFPEEGGQDSDRGVMGDAALLDVQETQGEIYHFTDKALEIGSTVKCVIDWERRFDYMQQHTGEHMVSGVAHRLFGCENVGFHLSEDIVTVDFDKMLTREQILEIEKEANKAVFENQKVKAFFPDSEALKTLEYRSKKEIDGQIRIVEIENTDMCACCAPHVKETGQVGLIKLLDSEKLRGGIRIEMKCGGRALRDYNDKYDNVRKISAALAVKQTETADGVERLLKNLGEMKFKITNLKRQSIDGKISAFNPERNITAVFEEDFEIKELQSYSDGLCKTYGGIRGVFSAVDGGFAFAICGENNELDKFFAEFKTAFTVRGGGRNGMVQGTVLAKREEIDEFFHE